MNSIKELQKRFYNSLKRGTGEAYLILRANPDIDFSDLIIKGAVKNFAYDAQCEGSRAAYAYRFIKKSKKKDKIIQAVLLKLQKKNEDDWSFYQMCDLAVMFFKDDYPEVKAALYKGFEENSKDNYDFFGQDQIMEIDGLEGVLHVAKAIGKCIREEDSWEDSYHIDKFQKKHKSIDVYAELKKVAATNKYVKAYYEAIMADKWRLPRGGKKIKRFSYELIKGKIDADTFRILSVKRANELYPQEVQQLADDFLNEKDKKKKELYLRFFAKRKFPYGYKSLLEMAQKRNPVGTRTVMFALEALSLFKSEDIRQFALEKIKTTKNPSDYLCLLNRNYRKGDAQLLMEIAGRTGNYAFIHDLSLGFRGIYEVNQTKECKGPLEMIYRKSSCGICRDNVVEILLARHVLSEQIFEELQFDSSDSVRKLYRENKMSYR